jgi:hypothetical protein
MKTGQGDIPLTMAFMIGLAGGFVCGAERRADGLEQIPTALQIHWHSPQRGTWT